MSESLLRNNDLTETVFKRNYATVYKIAYLRTGNTHDAEDIMQEVFLRYVKHKPIFESDEHEKAWFIRATINRTNSFFSSAWKRRIVMTEDEPIHYDETSDSSVLEAVMSLPKDMSTAVHLYYYEEMSVKDISDVMKKSESAVKSLLFRARKLLKIELTDSEKG